MISFLEFLLIIKDHPLYTICASDVHQFKLILLLSVLPCTWLGGGYNQISAAQWKGVRPLISSTHLLCANPWKMFNPFFLLVSRRWVIFTLRQINSKTELDESLGRMSLFSCYFVHRSMSVENQFYLCLSSLELGWRWRQLNFRSLVTTECSLKSFHPSCAYASGEC